MKKNLFLVAILLVSVGCNQSLQIQTGPNTNNTNSDLKSNSEINKVAQWHAPNLIVDQKLFTGSSEKCSSVSYFYYDVGTITAGPENGSEILLLNLSCKNQETSYWLYFLKSANNYVFLQKYSDKLDNIPASAITGIATHFTSDNNLDLPDLDLPKMISDPQNSVQLTKINTDFLFEFDGFFNPDPNVYEFAFKDNFGDSVYQKKNDAVDYQFYKADPSGLRSEYDYIPAFFNTSEPGIAVYNHPVDLIWQDRKIHNLSYSYNSLIGLNCNGTKLPQPKVTLADLVSVAQSKSGDVFYEFSDLNNSTIQMAKSHLASYDNPFTPDMILFWKDPFGKMVMLVNGDWDKSVCGG